MSRLYDTVEPNVIDDDMLQKAVEEQGPKDEAGRIAKAEGIDFADVTALRLDFRNILKIDNLWSFVNITKLQLDNNIIEKIEGLDVLRKLVWLDLSFNNIEIIEGLDLLTELEDVTLYNNRISRIENMDTLTKLHVLSVGNNDLKDLDNLVYLRRFPNLQTLNLSGNPIHSQENYASYIHAHLPKLEYLDYRLIDDQARQSAYQKYEISIQEIQHDEKAAERKEKEQAAKDEELALHRAAYVENLNGPYLFESMYSDDVDGQKLNNMPGVDELLILYKEKFTQICQDIFNNGLEKHNERTEEVNTFFECIEDAKRENKETASKHISEFLEYKRQLWFDLSQVTDSKIEDMKKDEYMQKTTELWDTLMGLELQLVDQLEDVIKDFERNMADMVTSFREYNQGMMTQGRDLENAHHERLLEIAIVVLEKVVKNELDEELPDDLRELFVDKDTIVGAVSASHDVHMLKIDNQEDDMVTRINTWMSDLIEDTHEREEINRNRTRIIEINKLIDHLRDEIDNVETQVMT